MSWKTPQKRKGVPTLFSMIVGYKNIDIRKQKNFLFITKGLFRDFCHKFEVTLP